MLSNIKPLKTTAHRHPILLFTAITLLWSWSFWIPIHIEGLPPGMKLALTFLGVFGPAMAGSILLRLRADAPAGRPIIGAGFKTAVRDWRSFLVHTLIFMGVITWLLVLKQHFGIDPEIIGVVGLVWGEMLIKHLSKTVAATTQDPCPGPDSGSE